MFSPFFVTALVALPFDFVLSIDFALLLRKLDPDFLSSLRLDLLSNGGSLTLRRDELRDSNSGISVLSVTNDSALSEP